MQQFSLDIPVSPGSPVPIGYFRSSLEGGGDVLLTTNLSVCLGGQSMRTETFLKLGYKMSEYSGEGIIAIWVTIISHKMLEMGETGVSIISQSLRLV